MFKHLLCCESVIITCNNAVANSWNLCLRGKKNRYNKRNVFKTWSSVHHFWIKNWAARSAMFLLKARFPVKPSEYWYFQRIFCKGAQWGKEKPGKCLSRCVTQRAICLVRFEPHWGKIPANVRQQENGGCFRKEYHLAALRSRLRGWCLALWLAAGFLCSSGSCDSDFEAATCHCKKYQIR